MRARKLYASTETKVPTLPDRSDECVFLGKTTCGAIILCVRLDRSYLRVLSSLGDRTVAISMDKASINEYLTCHTDRE